MPSLNQPNTSVDLTVRIFDDFYRFDVDVPVDEYDAVNSFFLSVFGDARSAETFTMQVFRVAQNSQTPVMQVLERMKNQDSVQLTSTIAYYLNGLQSPSTLLGINAISQPNLWAARNVIV